MNGKSNGDNTSAILDSLKSEMDGSSGLTAEARDAAITGWLRAKTASDVDIVDVVSPSASGASSEILLITLSRAVEFTGAGKVDQCVVRVKPGYDVYPETDMQRQYLCLAVAAKRSVAPVPVPLAFEEDDSILGAPFYLTELRTGKSAPDVPSYVSAGWIHDLSESDRLMVWKAGLQSIVELQQMDLDDGVLAAAVLDSRADNPLDQALYWWRRYYEFVVEDRNYPVLEEALRVLENERPDYHSKPVFVWGDASFRNMLFQGLKPSALLDFEFAHLGLREFDVAFYALVDRVMAEGFQQTKRLGGFMGKEDSFDYYESLSGNAVRDRDYYTLMASFYNTLAVTRNYQRVEKQGVITAEQVNYNPGMRILDNVLSGKD